MRAEPVRTFSSSRGYTSDLNSFNTESTCAETYMARQNEVSSDRTAYFKESLTMLCVSLGKP